MTAQDLVIFGVIILAGLGLSSLYSGLETGLYTINRVRLAVRASHGEPAAMRIRSIRGNVTRMLAMILVGNNIANYMTSFGIAAMLDRAGYAPAQAIVINAVVLIPVLFVFGEILPKDLFRTHTDDWTYRLSWFLRASQTVLIWTGLVPLVQWFGILASRLAGGDESAGLSMRQRVSLLIKEGVGAGVLSEVQTSLADRAMVLRDRRVRDEMVPWRDVVRARVDARGERFARLAQRDGFTRLPVVDGADRPMGIVSVLDVMLEPERTIESLMSPALEVDADLPVREALRRMQQERATMAIVTSGADMVGLVTRKDLVEPLTGELPSW
ncbi:MAG: CNNM domain-containing protein [Planctomycetota bacterium]|jgi:CBS domain containing-hemolysin-like protein